LSALGGLFSISTLNNGGIWLTIMLLFGVTKETASRLMFGSVGENTDSSM